MTTPARDTRTRLLEATTELIWSGGFHASGVEEICRSADVRKGSFYHYFPSKRELVQEALRTTWEEVRATVFDPILEGPHRGMARLTALIEAVDRLQRHEFEARGVYLGCAFAGLGQEMAHQDEGLRAVVDEVLDGHVAYFEEAIREAVEAGEAEPGDLRGRARRILALMEGALLVARVANDPERFTEVVAAVPALARADAD